jgi:hypothetical protein
LYGDGGDEGEEEFDFYLHGRKRSKLHDSLPAAAVQSHMLPSPATSLSSANLLQGSGGGEQPSLNKSDDSQYSLTRKMNRIFPPMPLSVPSAIPGDPLEEPSPLGLTLKKTPSLLDLITLQLAHGSRTTASDAANCEMIEQGLGKSGKIEKCSAPAGSTVQDKLKASNFPASTLKIGTWERVSRYEGDLVAKCYYAKRKLVWEVLDSGLKSKIEIQWSDISAMKATCPESLPGSLEILVSRPPLFFKETNPQPRKHTLWQATSDFTGGQATTCKRHSLQFPEGVLNKHYEKLVQCDPRLKALVEGTLGIGPSPLYDQSDAMFAGHSPLHLSKTFSPLTNVFEGYYQPLSAYSSLQGMCNRTGVFPEQEADMGAMDVHMSDISSPTSVVEIRGSDEGGNSDSEEYYTNEEFPTSAPFGTMNPTYMSPMCFDEHDLKPSLDDLSDGSNVSASNRKILDEIAQVLLGDSSATFSNEQAILLAAKMGSMQAVLARDFSTGPASYPQTEGFAPDVHYGYYTDSGTNYGQVDIGIEDFIGLTREQQTSPRLPKCNAVLDSSFNSVMQCLSKNNSTGDLLMNLPRIASLPQLV